MRRANLVAAIGVSFIAVASFLVLPLLVGELVHSLGFSEKQVGLFASAVMLGSTLSAALAAIWVRRVDWHRALLLTLAGLMAGNAISIFTDQFVSFLIAQFVVGFCGGAAYSLALTALSDGDKPERNFGFSIAAQVSFQVIGLMAGPYLAMLGGLDALLFALVILDIVALALLRWFPVNSKTTELKHDGSSLLRPATLLSLGGCFFFFFNVGCYWTYIELIGEAAGIGKHQIGLSLAGGVSFGIVGALFASWCGNRFGWIRPLGIGAAGTVIAVIFLGDSLTAPILFMTVALYNFVWNYSLAFQYAAINEIDQSGRGVAAAPAFHGAGGAAGPAVAAYLVSSDSFIAVNYLVAGSVLLSMVLFAMAYTLISNNRYSKHV
jgi:predicted MFS family arabinose efflux permease